MTLKFVLLVNKLRSLKKLGDLFFLKMDYRNHTQQILKSSHPINPDSDKGEIA